MTKKELIKQLKELRNAHYFVMNYRKNDWYLAVNEALQLANQLTTVNECQLVLNTIYRCGNCSQHMEFINRHDTNQILYAMKFCPNCGAKIIF